mmetsp:Transcript_46802/g.54245  ORF Transcript_46802/g.54245 Transcript_46802/m.54245 type:complete len:309 (-) Transcript_46802:187-1113(-)
MDSEDRTKAGICCGSCVAFIGILLFAISWGAVEPTEWGLKYNSISKNIDNSTVYDGGRYILGVFTSFVHFPRTLQTIEFSSSPKANAPPLRTRTGEGLALGLHIAFQYELIQDQIPALYTLANIYYEQTFVRIARDVILQTAGAYNAPQYWMNRTAIAHEMKKNLDDDLQAAHARCRYLQIIQIELPETYESSIVDTQIEQQNTQIKRFEQEATLIRKQIDILRSEADQNITITNATAQADAYSIRQSAEAQVNQATIKAEKSAYMDVEKLLKLTPEQLSQYIFFNSLQEKNAKMFVGFEKNVILNEA